jgi:hypothetical protein
MAGARTFRIRTVVEIVFPRIPDPAITVDIGQKFIRLEHPVAIAVRRPRPDPLDRPCQHRGTGKPEPV